MENLYPTHFNTSGVMEGSIRFHESGSKTINDDTAFDIGKFVQIFDNSSTSEENSGVGSSSSSSTSGSSRRLETLSSVDTNYHNGKLFVEEFQNDEMVLVCNHRFYTPFIESKDRVKLMWQARFQTDSLDICSFLFIEEVIDKKLELCCNKKLPQIERDEYEREVDLLRELQESIDFSYVTIMNLLDVYRRMVIGDPFDTAIMFLTLKSNRTYTVSEIKEEILVRTKEFMFMFGKSIENSNESLSRLQVTIISIFGNLTDFTMGEFIDCFPFFLLEKYLEMVADNSLQDHDKIPMLRYLKGLAEKATQQFYSTYYDTLFTKRNLFVQAPQFSSYWVNILFLLSRYAPGIIFRYIISKIAELLVYVEQDESQKDATLLIMLDCLSQIMSRHGREFVLANSDAFDCVDVNQFRSISLQKQFFKIQNEFEMSINGSKTSPISIYMKSLEKTSHNNTIFIVDFNGTKKKMSMLDGCGYSDLLLLIEGKFSVDRNDVLINIFDQDCRDYVELDPSEHDFKKMSQPIKIKITERVEKQDITESSILSTIDQYKISRQLKSDKVQTAELISITFLAEEKQLNKETRKIAIKYLNFKGSKAEGNLSENIITLKKVKEFEKSNLVPIYDILKPESINKQKVKKVHHLAFTLPYYTHGSVATLIKEKISLSTRMILSLLKYSLEGFNTLEEARFEYGNIKEENILIESLDLSSGSIRVRLSGRFFIYLFL